MRHVIKKGVFDLWLDRHTDPFLLQEKISDRFWSELLPEMEKEFDAVADEDQLVCIDRLEIDLGFMNEGLIDSGAWVFAFRKELQKVLGDALAAVAVGEGGSREPLAEGSFRQWCYYMENGCLPWNAGKPKEEWFMQVLEAVGSSYTLVQQLRVFILRHDYFLKRVVVQHPPVFLAHLVELLTAKKQEGLPTYILQLAQWVHSLSTDQSPDKFKEQEQKQTVQKIWRAVLQMAAAPKRELATGIIVEELLTHWLKLSVEELSALVAHHPLDASHKELKNVVDDLIKYSPEERSQTRNESVEGRQEEAFIKPGIHHTEKTEGEQESKNETIHPLSEKEITQQKLASVLTENANAKQPPVAEEETAIPGNEVYVTHAGLVLLHPFLHTFFKKLKLTANGAFMDLPKQERAICLLHELAGSGTPIYEYDLALPKLLCAWPLHRPVQTRIELTEEEKEEAQSLLLAAIDQWEILKTTSPAALQTTFLQREGKLSTRDGGWLLQVEKSFMDILLGQLPWTISMVKLPWMKDLLRIEWI